MTIYHRLSYTEKHYSLLFPAKEKLKALCKLLSRLTQQRFIFIIPLLSPRIASTSHPSKWIEKRKYHPSLLDSQILLLSFEFLFVFPRNSFLTEFKRSKYKNRIHTHLHISYSHNSRFT